jgi:hypothetical protein
MSSVNTASSSADEQYANKMAVSQEQQSQPHQESRDIEKEGDLEASHADDDHSGMTDEKEAVKGLAASAAVAPTAAAPTVPPAAPPAAAPAAPAGGGMPSFPEGGRDAWITCFGSFWAVFISFGFLNAFGSA